MSKLFSFDLKREITIEEVLESWMSLKATNTLKRYNSVLKPWQEYAGAAWLNASDKLALGFLNDYAKRQGQAVRGSGKTSPVTRATIKNAASVLHSLYKELKMYNVTTHDPWEFILTRLKKVKSGDKRETRAMPVKYVNRLLDSQNRNTKKGIRNLAMLSLLFGGGLRSAEVRNLTLADIARNAENIMIIALRQTKAGHPQAQPMPEWAAKNINALLEQRKNEGARIDEPLIINYWKGYIPDGQLAEATFKRLFPRLCREAGLPPYSCHAARATAITALLAAGIDQRAVKEFSRHATLQMIEQYDKRRFDTRNHPGLKLDYKKMKKEY